MTTESGYIWLQWMNGLAQSDPEAIIALIGSNWKSSETKDQEIVECSINFVQSSVIRICVQPDHNLWTYCQK